jgi:hypothetical protein
MPLPTIFPIAETIMPLKIFSIEKVSIAQASRPIHEAL